MNNEKNIKKSYFGEFGGQYVPDMLMPYLEQIEKNYEQIKDTKKFKDELLSLFKDYAGRPSSLYLAKKLSKIVGCKVYLKREDLNHTGSHKINNTLGQILLAKHMGKTEVIAETEQDSMGLLQRQSLHC